MGLDFDQLYPGKFMKAGEFQGRDLTLKVSSVKVEELGDGKDKEPKVVVSFSNAKKKLVMNKTNGTCLLLMFGRNTDAWIGKRVTFYPAPIVDPFTGEATIAIRVRGSPDIPQNIDTEARLGRKSVKFRLFKTQGRPAQAVPVGQQPTAPAPAPAAAPEPPPVEAEGPDSFGGSDFTDAASDIPF